MTKTFLKKNKLKISEMPVLLQFEVENKENLKKRDISIFDL